MFSHMQFNTLDVYIVLTRPVPYVGRKPISLQPKKHQSSDALAPSDPAP